jgi:acetylornithine deacetylase/succinyl-diaminopimelate desuccinylase-like protein
MLYKIEGKDKSLKPYLVTAHYDVVPADAQDWKFDPFSAQVHDNYIYARGSLGIQSSI